jgi:hypothetical protein
VTRVLAPREDRLAARARPRSPRPPGFLAGASLSPP